MKSLHTIPKKCEIFQIFVKVAMILAFVWVWLTVLGAVCATVWSGGGTVFGAELEQAYKLDREVFQ